jgi:hypothetical protein
MANANYIKRIQDIRERNILSRTKGKPLIFNEGQIIDLMMQNLIPTCMQHCILKVFPKMSGSEHEKFISAVNICAAVFQKYGYMKPGVTILSGKGVRNNTRHRLEVDAGAKHASYDNLKIRLWRGYLDRRDRALKAKKHIESIAASPHSNVVTQPPPSIRVQPIATPQTNIIGVKPLTSVLKPRGPTSSTRKLPSED